ncbi:MAG: hypothetical protein M1813_009817 [Trichoglossum hirsutum]|nr:MAG: hypothetical protein M1813_009817 [Trichoglossum hirsutum]
MADYTKIIKAERTRRRVRIVFGGKYIVDTTSAHHVWEHQYYPQYWVPIKDLHPDVKLAWDGGELKQGQSAGEMKVGDRKTDVVGFGEGALGGLVRFEFGAMDHWYEEDTEIYVHPKDPYRRIDILQSSRHIVVKIDGQTIAETRSAMLLIEPSLPGRYYLPPTSVLDWSLLSTSPTTTRCPYKGEAKYYNVTVNGTEHKDVIWWYMYPTPESIAIAGRLCFYNERVDIWIDGVKEERPKSKFG